LTYIFLYSFFSSVYLACAGFFFQKNERHSDNYIYLLIIYGAIGLSFAALFLNFFTALNPIINTSLFFIVLAVGLFHMIKDNSILKLFYASLLIAGLSTLIITLDNIYRPDASLYHLPYTKIITEHKIIFGVSNIHFRFGHTSILQYLNALFDNLIFLENGIIIPAAIIFSVIVLLFYNEIKSNYAENKIYTVFAFLALSYILYGYNRYSEFGNDALAHLFFLLICLLFLKKDLNNSSKTEELGAISLISIFCFMLKPTLLLVILIPLYYIFFSLEKKYFLNLINLFILFFLLSWFIKNIIISGCLIYPVEITCFNQLPWYNSDINYPFSATIQSLDNEAWTKGWPDHKGEIVTQEQYVKKFFWLETWVRGHGLLIIKKLSIFIFFVFTFLIFLKKIPMKITDINYLNNIKITQKLLFLLTLSFFGILLWFLRFPVFRYGSSYFVIFLITLACLIANSLKLDNKNNKIFYKYLKFFLILFFLFFSLKHFIRIYKNYEKKYINSPWPQFHSSKQTDEIFKSDIIKINENTIYYILRSIDGCGYNKSPCAPYELKNVILFETHGYKFYNLKK
jgi:hypothetical protein